jgi:hypothetical protein
MGLKKYTKGRLMAAEAYDPIYLSDATFHKGFSIFGFVIVERGWYGTAHIGPGFPPLGKIYAAYEENEKDKWCYTENGRLYSKPSTVFRFACGGHYRSYFDTIEKAEAAVTRADNSMNREIYEDDNN